MFNLFQLLIGFSIGALMLATGEFTVGVILFYLFILGTLLPSISIMVRRLHDTSRSGWWYFINFVPLVGPIVFFIFTVLPSTPGDNLYGPNPYGIPAAASMSSIAATPSEPTVPQA